MKYLPMKKYLSNWLVVALLLAQVFTFAPLVVHAAPPAPPELAGKYDPTLTEDGIRAQLGLGEEVDVVTDSELSRLIALCHVIGAYLVHEDDGTLSLRLDDPRAVGVSESFLNDYRTGLAEINELIKREWVTVDDNFDLQPGRQFPEDAAALEAGLAEIENQVAGEDVEVALPAGKTPDYRSRGFLFSFHSRRYSVPYGYASLGPTFASYYRYGRYGARFSLLFGFNRGFFGRTYRYGGYGYVPYYSSYRYGYNRFYYYPYSYGGYYGRWYYRYLYY